MKNYKLLALLLPVLTTHNSLAAESFITKEAQPYLVGCQTYNDSKPIKIFGMEGSQSLSISPQSDGSCKVETITDMDMMTNIISCSFNQEQISELVVAFADDGSQEHAVQLPIYMEHPDGTRTAGGSMTMRGTLEEVTIAKFMNNPDVCQTKNVDKQEEMKKEFIEALDGCKDYATGIEIFGFEMKISLSPLENGLCKYNIINKIPSVTASINGQEKKSEGNKVEVDCILTSEQMKELAEYVRSGKKATTYKYKKADGGEGKVDLMVPQVFLKNDAVCTVKK